MICSFVIKMIAEFSMRDKAKEEDNSIATIIEWNLSWRRRRKRRSANDWAIFIYYYLLTCSQYNDGTIYDRSSDIEVDTYREEEDEKNRNDLTRHRSYLVSVLLNIFVLNRGSSRRGLSKVKFKLEMCAYTFDVDFVNQHTNISSTTITSRWWLASSALSADIEIYTHAHSSIDR